MFELMEKARNKKGFTLMEMLIVVAIIAILVAIIIPVFSSQLDKAKVASDAANIRSAYAMVQTCNLLQTNPDGTDATASVTYYLQKDGSFLTSDANAYKTQIGGTKTADQCPVLGSGSTWTEGKMIKVTSDASKVWSLSVN